MHDDFGRGVLISILHNLYNGKHNHFGASSIDTLEYVLVAGMLADLEDEITNDHLEIRKLFSKSRETQAAVTSVSEYEMLAAGFHIGAELILEMLGARK